MKCIKKKSQMGILELKNIIAKNNSVDRLNSRVRGRRKEGVNLQTEQYKLSNLKIKH